MTVASVETSRLSPRRRAVLDLETARLGGLAQQAAATRGLSMPILLKGPAVARHYPNPLERPYRDIDLLVPESEIEAWEQVLTERGYSAPTRWARDARARRSHHLVLVREVGGELLLVELHWTLNVERAARHVDYNLLVRQSKYDVSFGLLVPEPGALLVILALHLMHHQRDTWRTTWLEDFAAVGTAARVREARKLAGEWRVSWALESALSEAQLYLGEERWRARWPRDEGPPVRRLAVKRGAGLMFNIALAREFGVVGGMRYLVTRVDPARFRRDTGAIDRDGFAVWLGSQVQRARTTRWSTLGRSARSAHAGSRCKDGSS